MSTLVRFRITNIILVLVLIVSGCQRKPHWQADISGIEPPEVSISRYEQALFNLNPFTLRQDIDPFIDEFYFFLGEEIDTPEGQQQLYDYVTDPFLRDIFLDVQEVWPDTRNLEASFAEAFRYYRHHFPDEPLPRLYTYVSGLDYQMPVKYAENHMVIGIDMYLGSVYHNYQRAGIPTYMTHRFTPAHAAMDAMRMLAEKHLQQWDPQPETFLDFMVYEGKVLFFLDNMFPTHSDTLKMPYTALQLDWIRNNAGQVWSYYIENELIYSTDRQMINKFIGDAPFTAAFGRNSAPRTGAWIGWQIVREYMRRHPEVSLQELLRDQDSRKILMQSRYRPR
jgi:hypothetical protein